MKISKKNWTTVIVAILVVLVGAWAFFQWGSAAGKEDSGKVRNESEKVSVE